MALRAGKIREAQVREVFDVRSVEGRACYWILTLACKHETFRIQNDKPICKWAICEKCSREGIGTNAG
jgi:hypothetical protein